MKLSQKEKNRLRERYGEWALITGASSGIGKELSRLLASAGLNLVLNARNEEKLSAIAQSLRNEFQVQATAVVADLATTDGMKKVIAEVNHLPVGMLVASAGFGTSGLFLNSSVHQEVNMLRVNCEALLRLTHHFSGIFAAQKRGGIILLSSMVAFQGVPYAAHYSATKAYVQSLGEGLSEELRPQGVDVLAAAPGPVKSGFGQRANMKMDMALTPEQIGVPILKALGRKATTLPGGLTKFLVYSLRTVPRWGKVKIMKKVMGGMTAHQK